MRLAKNRARRGLPASPPSGTLTVFKSKTKTGQLSVERTVGFR